MHTNNACRVVEAKPNLEDTRFARRMTMPQAGARKHAWWRVQERAVLLTDAPCVNRVVVTRTELGPPARGLTMRRTESQRSECWVQRGTAGKATVLRALLPTNSERKNSLVDGRDGPSKVGRTALRRLAHKGE